MLDDHATCNQGRKLYDLSTSKHITQFHSNHNVIYCGNEKGRHALIQKLVVFCEQNIILLYYDQAYGRDNSQHLPNVQFMLGILSYFTSPRVISHSLTYFCFSCNDIHSGRVWMIDLTG